jgi:hypothetical protein
VYQRVPATRGVEYRLTVNSNRSDPFNNGQVNEVTLIGIDPLGGADAGADSVAWSAPEYVSKTWTPQSVRATAQSDNVTVFLRARANYGGLGMEGKFAKASLRLVSTTAAAGGAK